METKIQISASELCKTLKRFTGTSMYYRHTLSNGMFLLLTEGCNYIRENAGDGAYWLYDLILSFQCKLRKHRFQAWNLRKQEDESFYIECSDGNHNFIIGQDIPYSDFPLDNFELWVIDGVALLPSEY